jgi:hypothetical protein
MHGVQIYKLVEHILPADGGHGPCFSTIARQMSNNASSKIAHVQMHRMQQFPENQPEICIIRFFSKIQKI